MNPDDPQILAPLPSLLVEQAVRAALLEDLGRAGDVTSDAVVRADAKARAHVVAREEGRLAGLDLAVAAFRLLDEKLKINGLRHDGQDVEAGQIIATISGAARFILAAERVALNYLGHLSGIATLTRAYVRAVAKHKARIACTRKTTPGLRAFEKYAVRAGGGVNHRFGLDDGILIKDNHIAVAGGVVPALRLACERARHMLRIEVEVDTIGQLEEAIAAGADVVLLDNMDPATLTRAVEFIDGRAIAEASGGVTLDTVADIAATGVDLISVGAITHSAPSLDFGLDVEIG